jgi:hypothetical protein
VELTYCVGSVVVPLAVLTHCTTEQGRMPLPVTTKERAGLPASALDGNKDVIACGAARFAAGDVMVNESSLDVPEEFDTETAAVAGEAVSVGRIVAVRCVESTTVVTRGDPFQLTIESLVNVVPLAAVTVSVKLPVLPQKGAEEGEMDPIDGTAADAELIVKRTILDTSVVVVLLMLVPDVAEPGICTASCTVPGVVRSEAGTGAVN